MKKLSLQRKGEIAVKVLQCLPPPTEKEMRAIAPSLKMSPSQIRKAMGEIPRHARKLKKAS